MFVTVHKRCGSDHSPVKRSSADIVALFIIYDFHGNLIYASSSVVVVVSCLATSAEICQFMIFYY